MASVKTTHKNCPDNDRCQQSTEEWEVVKKKNKNSKQFKIAAKCIHYLIFRGHESQVFRYSCDAINIFTHYRDTQSIQTPPRPEKKLPVISRSLSVQDISYVWGCVYSLEAIANKKELGNEQEPRAHIVWLFVKRQTRETMYFHWI